MLFERTKLELDGPTTRLMNVTCWLERFAPSTIGMWLVELFHHEPLSPKVQQVQV